MRPHHTAVQPGRLGFSARLRTYYLDRDEVEEVHVLARHRLDRVLGGVEGEDEDLDPREAEWVKWMAEMRETAIGLEEVLREVVAA